MTLKLALIGELKMANTWKKIASKQVYKNPFFSVEESDVIQPDGRQSVYYTVLGRTGVGVIAYDGKKVLMVNQYRIPLDRRVWSFVSGGAENDDLLADAQRELKEETGFTAKKWTRLGGFPTNPSMSTQVSCLFLAEQLSEGEHQRESGEQDMQYKFFTLDEVDELIAKGELSSFDITDFYLLQQHLKKSI